MLQSYPNGKDDGRPLISDMAHVVMPNEKLLCGKCRKELFIKYDHQTVEKCCGVTYTRRVHSYVIEAK